MSVYILKKNLSSRLKFIYIKIMTTDGYLFYFYNCSVVKLIIIYILLFTIYILLFIIYILLFIFYYINIEDDLVVGWNIRFIYDILDLQEIY